MEKKKVMDTAVKEAGRRTQEEELVHQGYSRGLRQAGLV